MDQQTRLSVLPVQSHQSATEPPFHLPKAGSHGGQRVRTEEEVCYLRSPHVPVFLQLTPSSVHGGLAVGLAVVDLPHPTTYALQSRGSG